MTDLNKLYEAIMAGRLEDAKKTTHEAVAENIDPKIIIDGYMSKAMEDVGYKFETGQVFVPELLMAARAMKGSLDLLKPLMTDSHSATVGKVVIGTVKGDLHDIGKNLVASMLEGCGFEVINLGVDVSSDRFVAATKEHNADILCLSALLTTTMNRMQEVIVALEERGLRKNVKVLIGGAPVSNDFAKQIGADGYSANANSAVSLAKSFF
jgi:corrinoid protein of di/trimethylamine methyltransferase